MIRQRILELVFIGTGGALGAILRWVVGGWVQRLSGNHIFPFGTLAVNVVGCLAIGVLGGLSESRQSVSDGARLFLIVGLLGGFTTYSTFGYETVRLLHSSAHGTAFLYVGIQMLAGFGAAWAGYAVAVAR